MGWQYVWVEIPNLAIKDVRGNRRAFSILNTKNDDNFVEIVARFSESGYKQSLFALDTGDDVTLYGPFGNSFVIDEKTPDNIIMIAGGVGIAAFLPMINTIKNEKLKQRSYLIYLNKDEESTPFLDELKGLKKNMDFFDYSTVYDKLSVHCINSINKDLKNNAQWWIAGSQGMVDYTYDILESIGVSRADMVFENFYPTPKHNLTADDVAKNLANDNVFAQALENSTNHTIITDSEGIVLYANRAAQNTTGFSEQEILGNTPRLWGGLMSPKFYKDFWKRKTSGLPFEGEIINRRKSGEVYYAMAHIAGTNGAMYYNASTNKFRCFENSAWADCITTSGASGSTKSVTKTANETITADTTLSNDSELKFNIGANESWTYRYVMQINSPTPADMKFAIAAPVGATCQATATSYKNNNSISQLGCGVSSGLMSTSATDEMIEVTGSVQNGANAGTITVQWAQNTSNAGNTIVYKGSFVNAFKETGADLAEIYYTHDNAQAGNLVSLDSSMRAGVRKTSGSYDSTVMGVISTKPGYVLADSAGSDPTAAPVALALSGRVPVKISDENGPVKAGDPLTSSSTPGVAMRATQPGWVIGMAMEDQTADIDNVMTFVNRSWYAGSGNTKVPSLTGLTLTDGSLDGVETAQTEGVKNGLESSDPHLISQALDILHGIQTTVVTQQTQINNIEAKNNTHQIAQAAFSGGLISGDTEFQANVIFDALTTFKGQTVFTGNSTFDGSVAFNGDVVFSENSAGTVTIPAGSTTASVKYTKALNPVPTPSVTPQEFITGQYRVTAITATGFVIELNQAQDVPTKFSWTAIQSKP